MLLTQEHFFKNTFFLLSSVSKFKLTELTLFDKFMSKTESKYAEFHKPK